MRQLHTAAFIFALCSPLVAMAAPAFPGAEGFGGSVTGGRGGAVLKVTTLDATGPGSLQEALDTAGPRIIVFDVSGVIQADEIVIPHGDVTIAGQTAPGGGITIDGRLVAAYAFGVDNIIVRHVRVRPTNPSGPGNQIDSIQMSLSARVILDHVSASFGVDETIDLYEARDVTVQWSTIESSATEGHPEGEHNYGLINGPDGARASIHHNLFVHNKNRNPALATGPSEVRNNVVYNVRHGFVHHNPAAEHFSIVGNYYKAGGDDDLFPFFFDDENGGADSNLRYYLEDNYIQDPGIFEGVVSNPWMEPHAHPSFDFLGLDESYRAEQDFDFASANPEHIMVTMQASQDAYGIVLACAGAWPRDVVTLRSVDETMSGTGTWGANIPPDLMEGLVPEAPPPDADGDGMPDDWESNNGLDPNDGTDHTTELPSGYPAIETYLNERAAEVIGDPDCTEGGGGDDGGPGLDLHLPSDSSGEEGGDSGSATGGNQSTSGSAETSGSAGTSPGGTTGGSSGTTGGGASSEEKGCSCGIESTPLSGVLPLGLWMLARRRRRTATRSRRS